MIWPSLAIAAANLLLFVVGSGFVLSGKAGFSHHWLIPFHEAALLGQVVVLGRRAPARVFLVLSLLVLGVSVARMETIFLSHHLIHMSMAWGLAAALHRRLSLVSGAAAGKVNSSLAVLAAAWAVITLTAALLHGIWWGISDGT